MKLRDILWSWDFVVAAATTCIVTGITPCCIPADLAKEVFSMGISVLSIVFSVFFAALAILISSSDDEFVTFLEEEGDYTKIIESFQFTLIALGIALLTSIIFFVFSAVKAKKCEWQSEWTMDVFTFLFVYGLLAVMNATSDAIRYSSYRSRFLRAKKKNPKQNSN